MFRSAYDELPAPMRAADGALMLALMALILRPSANQRIVLGA
ncbi:MAG: hypothetical protein QJR07_21885 [Acetobacteraceae bacterium]|nr:hypothetical protein [Acetobacteraceae bacterium]